MSLRKPYSNIEIFSEEAYRKDQHGMAIVLEVKDIGMPYHRKGIPWMRIIPSLKWYYQGLPEWFIIQFITHESIHICLWRLFGLPIMALLDKLPRPNNEEEFKMGVWGYG